VGTSRLYDEIITLCLDLSEFDAAIAVVADMEANGIKVTDEILDRVLSAKQGSRSTTGPVEI
jgi:pentatricopeptide repeat protein